jgi:hypothetical protein
MLEDIATLVGDQAISGDLGKKLDNVSLDMLGRDPRAFGSSRITPASPAARATATQCAADT